MGVRARAGARVRVWVRVWVRVRVRAMIEAINEARVRVSHRRDVRPCRGGRARRRVARQGWGRIQTFLPRGDEEDFDRSWSWRAMQVHRA